MQLKQFTSNEIGKIIKNRRSELNIRQCDLALASGTGVRFIIELEQGKPTCQLQKVLTVMRTLGLKISVEGNSR